MIKMQNYLWKNVCLGENYIYECGSTETGEGEYHLFVADSTATMLYVLAVLIYRCVPGVDTVEELVVQAMCQARCLQVLFQLIVFSSNNLLHVNICVNANQNYHPDYSSSIMCMLYRVSGNTASIVLTARN